MNSCDSFQQSLNELLGLQQELAEIHPALEKPYPVAICINDHFLIYDQIDGEETYRLIKSVPLSTPMPEGIRAAFPLQEYGEQIAAVVTPEIFESLDGCAILMHEFVHCFQFSTCEQELKMSLDIARRAQEVGDVMWEINYPFPYTANLFINGYQQFLNAVDAADECGIGQARQALRSYLGVHDFQYMVWQEWKEGLARWVENRVQHELNLAENLGGKTLPYSRVSFYAGGAAYINFLSARESHLVNNLPKLFLSIYTH